MLLSSSSFFNPEASAINGGESDAFVKSRTCEPLLPELGSSRNKVSHVCSLIRVTKKSGG
jgi:hypothetical protein